MKKICYTVKKKERNSEKQMKGIRNISFRKKMTLIFTIVCTFSTCIAGSLYYGYAQKEIVSNFNTNAKSLVSQLENTLDTRLKAINRRVFAALTNPSFIKPFGDYLNAPTQKKEVIMSGEIANWLKDIRIGEPLVHSALIYTNKGSWDDYTKVRNWEFSFSDSIFGASYHAKEKQAIQWIPTMKDEIFIGNEQVIPYVRRFTVQQYMKEDAYLIIQLDQAELLKEVAGNTKTLGQILITDELGHYIASTMEITSENLTELLNINFNHEEQKYSSDIKYNGEDYLISKGVVGINNWQIYILKSKDDLLERIIHLRRVIFGMSIVMIGVSLFLVAFLSKQLTSSLQRLAVQMNRMRNGEREARYYYPYKDEVGSLAKTFNYMADEIQTSMKKQEEYISVLKEERDFVAQVQEQKRKAELRALQAQINPHFLYNTLNTITWLASDKGVDEVRILSNSLGRFFRISLSKGAEEITIQDEIEHVKSYLNIQGIRYATTMEYQIQVPEKLMQCTILKLVLQPLVENAIYHGTKEKDEMSHISIKGKLKYMNVEETGIQFEVLDDGMGIAREKLESINKGLEEGRTDSRDGYGIFNVNERIKLYYGINYGLSYESEEGKWTKAILTLPLRSKEDVSCIKY